MEKEILTLPLLISGMKVEGGPYIRLEYDDLIVRFPSLNDETREAIGKMDRRSIHQLSLREITSFLQKVAHLWINEDYPLRQKLMEYGPRISGQSPQMYKHNIGLLLQIISFQNYMTDLVDCELGDKRLLDEWIPKENGEIHAEPLGSLLHIISGNVSLVGFYSLIRGLLTKNVNIVKLSQKDFLATYYFIQSFADVDPDHPVTKAVSTVYWSKDDDLNINHFCNSVNGMVIWGGYDTIQTYKSKCPVGCEFIEYGPKKGIQIIDYDNNDDKYIELNVARDICVFDQEACLSPQLILIKGTNLQRFKALLAKGLYHYSALWPSPKYSIDHYAHKNQLIESHRYLGNYVVSDDERNWVIIELSDSTPIPLDHPLGRTIFIKEIQDFDECLNYIDGYVQTVGIAPKSLARQLRDELTIRGVTRIANIGNVELVREGLVHEGIGMNRLVRMVGMERENDYMVKNYDVPEHYFDQFTFKIKFS